MFNLQKAEKKKGKHNDSHKAQTEAYLSTWSMFSFPIRITLQSYTLHSHSLPHVPDFPESFYSLGSAKWLLGSIPPNERLRFLEPVAESGKIEAIISKVDF